MPKKRSPETRAKIAKTLSGRKLTDEHRANIGAALRGDGNPNWRGGRGIDPVDGYVRLYMPGSPMASPNGYVREHRLVMANHLGRLLDPSELIHHVNGDRTDNRIENLQIVTAGEHMTIEHTGRKRSAETRAKMTEAQRSRRARERGGV